MGEAFVGMDFANVDNFSAPLQGFVSRNSWGKSWCREGLDLKTRRMT
jgi:4-carboxymuconolactone decarboxylase